MTRNRESRVIHVHVLEAISSGIIVTLGDDAMTTCQADLEGDYSHVTALLDRLESDHWPCGRPNVLRLGALALVIVI